MTEPIQDYYDADVAKLNALAAKSAARAEELKAENEKLRELVRETLMDPTEYAHKYDLPEHDWNAVNAHLDMRMRELGIEVQP